VRGLAVILLVLSIVYQAGICSMPYFVIRMFGGHMSWVDALATTMFIYAAIAFIPTPGNAGAAEGSFYLVFSMLTQGRIFWAMLVWRFFCYYIYIIWGIGNLCAQLYHRQTRHAENPRLPLLPQQ
jgi:uncharacterized membrane protein YbhN (UPF0104 family)